MKPAARYRSIGKKARDWLLVLLGLLVLSLPCHAQAPAPTSPTLPQEETDWLAVHRMVRPGIDPNFGPSSFLDDQEQLQAGIMQGWLPIQVGEIQRPSQPTLPNRLLPWLLGLFALSVLGYLVVLLWNHQLKLELARRRAELERVQAITHMGDWSLDITSGRIQWSKELFRIVGRSPMEMDWPTLRGWLHPDARDAHAEYLSRLATLLPGEQLPPLISHLLRPDGSSCWLEISCATDFDTQGKPRRHYGTALELTERKQAEESIRRLNRLYAVLSGINEAIVRLREPQALFDEACRIAVDVGGFRMAWLGMTDADRQEILPRAHAGVADDYLENLHISLGDDARGHGPTGIALRAGQHAVCNHIASAPHMAPWREAALALGYQASAAFPIRVGDQVCGAFSLYADQAKFFDADELRLLDKLANDIGFALDFMETNRVRETLNRRIVNMLESMSDGFVSLDREWRCHYINRKAAEMLGREPDELLDKHIWTEFPEGVGQPFHQTYQRAMNEGVMVSQDEYYPPWDRWFENRIYPTQDGISIFFTDITVRKKQEEELKRLHSTLNALIEGSTDVIFVKNQEGRFIVGNHALAVLLGRPIVEILGADDRALFPAELAERFRADDQRIMAAGVTETYEEPVVTPAATFSHLTTKGPLIIGGEVRGVFGISRDITDRKRAEAALQENETRLRLFIEHAPAALAMFDRQMRYLVVSHRWLTDYRLEGGDILGRSHYEIFPEIPDSWKEVHRRGLAGEVVRSDEDRFERQDGNIQWLQWEVRPWYAADHAVGGIVIFTEDVTARMEAEIRARQGEIVLDSVFEALPDLFFLMDPDGTIRDYRAQHDGKLYVPPEAFLGKRMQDVMPAEHGDLFQRKKDEIGRQGGLATYEYDLTIADGKHHFEARMTRLPESEQMIVVVRDISREYHDRLALVASEVRYRELFEQSPAPMLVYEKGGLRLLAVNEAFTRHYGYSRDESLALHLPDLYPEAEKMAIMDVTARITGLTYVGEWHHLKKDGNPITIEARSHDIQHDGHAARIVVITDITERKQMELRLLDQLDELTRWQTVMLGREERVQVLKAEVNQLLAEQDQPIRYPSQAEPS